VAPTVVASAAARAAASDERSAARRTLAPIWYGFGWIRATKRISGPGGSGAVRGSVLA
jgi:hypothetical protein